MRSLYSYINVFLLNEEVMYGGITKTFRALWDTSTALQVPLKYCYTSTIQVLLSKHFSSTFFLMLLIQSWGDNFFYIGEFTFGVFLDPSW